MTDYTTNYTKKAVRSTGMIFVFSIAAGVLGYLLRLLLANKLTKADFGLFYAMFAFVSFLLVFKDLGLGQALVKFIPEFQVKNKYNSMKNMVVFVFLFNILFAIVLAVLLFVFSNYLSLTLFHNPDSAFLLKLFSIYFILQSIMSILISILQGFQRLNYYAMLDFSRTTFVLIFAYFMLRINLNVLAPVMSYILMPVFISLLFIPIILRRILPIGFWKSKLVYDSFLIKKLFAFSIPTLFTVVGVVALGNIDSIMISYFKGLEAVGLYNVALPTALILGYFSVALMTVIFPMSSELWASGSFDKLKDGMYMLYKYSLIIIFPFILIMVCFPEIILNIFFGVNYIAASNVLRILSLGIIMVTISRINLSVLSGIGKPKLNSLILLAALIFNIISNFILIPFLGILGAAITTFFSFFIMVCLSVYFLRKHLKFDVPLLIWFKTFVAGILFTIVLFVLKDLIVLHWFWELLIVIPIGFLVYLFVLFTSKTLNMGELKSILNRVIK